ncbi:hypothetical protein NFI96_012498 [Prochilodus magdalenae]|nr:hypothetical protein NFI96_012498 [Prochilodus magdalenae]
MLKGLDSDQETRTVYELLINFIYSRICRNGNRSVTLSQLGGTESNDPTIAEIGQRLQWFGDTIDNDTRLQRLLRSPVIKPTKDVFLKVAREIFSDGRFNWGRVVALFYFACELVKQVLEIPDLIKTIINWTVTFMRETVFNWIREQGGWEAICSLSMPTWQTVGVFLAGALTTALVVRRM